MIVSLFLVFTSSINFPAPVTASSHDIDINHPNVFFFFCPCCVELYSSTYVLVFPIFLVFVLGNLSKLYWYLRTSFTLKFLSLENPRICCVGGEWWLPVCHSKFVLLVCSCGYLCSPFICLCLFLKCAFYQIDISLIMSIISFDCLIKCLSGKKKDLKCTKYKPLSSCK